MLDAALVFSHGLNVDFDPHPYAFPDISLGEFGVEVKFTSKDTWRSVANSIFETFRNPEIVYIYVVFGKMGGKPEVKWQKYEDSVIHVRTSHVPRFELEISDKSSLFQTIGISYHEFCTLTVEHKMEYIRKYAKSRLKDGERLWWIEHSNNAHSLPLQVRLYIDLPNEEKRRLRAEAALLSPKIVGSRGAKNKYGDVAIYLLTYHGVLASQTRDLYSAGSVALKASGKRGDVYIKRALLDLEDEMIQAANNIDDALFVEYWGQSVLPNDRIKKVAIFGRPICYRLDPIRSTV